MDTPEFNRLRRIKQLGLAHYVFPSATHTRFEHCIGVMNLAGKVVDILNSHLPNSISPREKSLVQLAGLFHDVGHTAFSHLMDYILQEKNIKPEISHHENRSITLLKKVNSRLKILSSEEEQMVGKMILGENDTEKPFLYEIVNNLAYGLDVDRLDYLQRDAYHTGMPFFQADYIIECMRIKNNRLTILKKAKPELEAMYEARKRLLTLVCRHKTVMKIEKIIRLGVEKLNITGDWFEKNWEKFDDYRAYCMLENNCPEIFEPIHTRNLMGVDTEDRFNHISYISREDIDSQLEKVLWY